MSKKSCFRGCFEKQHVKRAQVLLKYGLQHLYHIHRSLPRKLSLKKALLLTCEIFLLLFNTLAADEKYLVLQRDSLTISIQMQFSQKQKTVFSVSFFIFEIYIKFWKFWEKTWPSQLLYFRNYALWKLG